MWNPFEEKRRWQAAKLRWRGENKKEQRRSEAERRRTWLRLTGLPPPEERGFVPRTAEEEDNRPAGGRDEFFRPRPGDKDINLRYLRPHEGAFYPRDDPGPGWENAVRAYEDEWSFRDEI